MPKIAHTGDPQEKSNNGAHQCDHTKFLDLSHKQHHGDTANQRAEHNQ